MPPRAKRTSDAIDGGNATAANKSTKTAGKQSARSDGEDGSNNKGEEKKRTVKNTDGEELDPYEYVTICKPRDEAEAEDDDEEEFESKSASEEGKCGGEGCMCHKKPEDYPEWPWVITREGKAKLFDQRVWSDYRNPDAFGMYTFNDHEGYGRVELVENLLLEFDKAKDPKDQWVVMEALAHWMSSDDIEPFYHVDDADRVSATLNVVGLSLLACLNTLDREGLLKPDSEVKDLTLVMGLFLKIAERSNDVSDVLLLDNEEQQQWPHFIVALAKEKGLDMAATGLADIGDAVKEWEDGDELPPAKADRFGFKSALKTLQKQHGTSATQRGAPKIGGHKYDITKWSRAERAKAAFDKKDPLPDDIVQGLKRGEQIMLA